MSAQDIDYSKIAETIKITPLRKIESNPGQSIYHVKHDSKKYYFIIPSDKNVDLKTNQEYSINISKKMENKIFASLPLKYELMEEEYEAEVISNNELEKAELSLYRGRAELPSIEEIDQQIERYEYVKKRLIKPEDQLNIKGKTYTKKSGWRKFINAFGLSIELIDKRVYNTDDDKHAEVRVRAIAPNGQSVEGIGIKSMSNVFGDKSLHNLVATAWTKAVNRAVSDLVAFGAVSAEEIQDK